ncbi:acetyl-CoA carboxylase biotin carboxyl carrier protein [Pedobacter sp. JCM 36344]|uniref:acetyl-CoA carboxylase biotin carboxyl carrier protein n=1 Tax=Pedobacter sp. JCM 36344 TaxID=3374280 RepID=UPI00397C2CC3
MDIKQIQELIKFVSRSGVNEVAIEQENFKITIKTNQAPTIVQASLPAPVATVAIPAAAAPLPSSVTETKSAEGTDAEVASKYITIKSPMIGTFYRSSSPDKPFFLNVGDEVSVGKVVCIIEAMKLFNEIESEVSGKVVKILVDNASPVEYDQPLFLVEPM